MIQLLVQVSTWGKLLALALFVQLGANVLAWIRRGYRQPDDLGGGM